MVSCSSVKFHPDETLADFPRHRIGSVVDFVYKKHIIIMQGGGLGETSHESATHIGGDEST